MNDSRKRLKILDKNEIEELYGFPHFSSEDREKYFSLEPFEKNELKKLRSVPSKVNFILDLGYFKAKKMFFTINHKEAEEDIKYILQTFFPQADDFQNLKISNPTRLTQQAQILHLLDYRDCTVEIRKILEEKALNLVSIHTKPVYVFKELLHYLEKHRIVVPVYSFMQDIVGQAITAERERLESAVIKNISMKDQQNMNNLLCADEYLHALTLLKKEPKDFSHKEIVQEVSRRESLTDVYEFARKLIPMLGISNENIKYYASLVDYYTVYKLKRMRRETTYVYLICFIFNRFQKINDNLVNTFIYYVNKYTDEAERKAREKVYEYKIEGNKHLKDVGKILGLFVDETIPEDIEFQKVKEIAFAILEKEKFSFLSSFISNASVDDTEYEWDHYINLARKFKINLRYLFLNIDFKSQKPNDPLLKAVIFLKKAFREGKSLTQFKTNAFPHEFIPTKLKRYLYDTHQTKVGKKSMMIKELNVTKYEFLIYRLLKFKLESGDVFVKESVRFRSFEEDLIDNEKWNDKDNIIKNLDLPYLHKSIDDILIAFEEAVENSLNTVNNRIKEKKNQDVKITGKGDKIKWSIPYKKIEESANNPIYEQFLPIGIVELINFVDEQCGFIPSFTHLLDKYSKSEADNQRIVACIVACGTNIGLFKMAESSDISYQELVGTTNNFIRLETLKDANDKISNVMAKLPIFKYYNIAEEIIHSSSDGQKYETQFDTINSRYSPKYFGLNKGISACTLVANHVPINAKIIGANEHESHYVFDLLFNNTSDIKSKIHSTDSYGTNEVNFAILHIFGYMFAPRYKNLSSRAKSIYSFSSQSEYQNCLLKPIRKINTRLIKEEWENIQKIIVSLALKSTTQSTIIGKLSSYERKNRTKKALWEFDNIIKTLYILNYVDSPYLRQNVQKAINRGESHHKLKKAIFYANFGKFRVKTELEQQIWSECTRLIANSIIFYNAFILSKLLEHMEAIESHEKASIIKKLSPVAWRHINLYGKYEFHSRDRSFNVSEIVSSLLEKVRFQLKDDEINDHRIQ